MKQVRRMVALVAGLRGKHVSPHQFSATLAINYLSFIVGDLDPLIQKIVSSRMVRDRMLDIIFVPVRWVGRG